VRTSTQRARYPHEHGGCVVPTYSPTAVVALVWATGA